MNQPGVMQSIEVLSASYSLVHIPLTDLGGEWLSIHAAMQGRIHRSSLRALEYGSPHQPDAPKD